jgi:hypothetical protein
VGVGDTLARAPGSADRRALAARLGRFHQPQDRAQGVRLSNDLRPRRQDCVFRRIRPPVPAEAGRPFRAKSATPNGVPSRGCDFYCSRVAAVKEWRCLRIDSPVISIL